MSNQIFIPGSQASFYIDFLRDRIANTREELRKLEDSLANISGQIETQLDISKPNRQKMVGTSLSNINKNDYDPNWTWLQKIRFILEGTETATTADVVKEILRREPERQDTKETIIKSVSAIISMNSKENGIFGRQLTDNKENRYFVRKK